MACDVNILQQTFYRLHKNCMSLKCYETVQSTKYMKQKLSSKTGK